MNCVIPGPNLKILGKAIHALAKVGDEIYFEANNDYMSLRTVNISTTVFGFIKFLSPFFTHYNITDGNSQSSSNSQKGISCKMPMKALLSVFKNTNQMEKQIEICKIEIDENPTKITFKFRYKNEVSKTHNVWLLDGDESLDVGAVNNDNSNKISASSVLYTQALANFQLSDGEVSIDVSPQKIILRNFTEGEVTRINHIRSQLSLSPVEFSIYRITKSTTITFSLKSLRAAIQFAENFNLGITLVFQQSGKPMEIIISNNITFEANFILATMSTDTDTQSTLSTMATEINENIKPVELKQNTRVDNIDDYFNSEDLTKDIIVIPDEVQVIPNSPDSPQSKKIKFHFKRCFEPTFNGLPGTNEEIYAENSDPECEALLG